MSTDRPVDTLVVGLDGACFDLVKPWVETGELPAIKEVFDHGVTGPLESVRPPVTSPAWKAYATGKNPGKLGIFWWYNIDTDGQETYLPVDRYQSHTEFWEIIAEDDPVGVIGVPNTYPPNPLNGFVVAGAPDGQNSGFTHPPELEQELSDRFDYRVVSQHHRQERSQAAFEEMLELIDQRFSVAEYLLDTRDISFLQVTTYYLNNLHHSIWEDEYTLKAWKLVDDHLATLLDRGENIVLMSDHGMAEIQSVFRINQWFKEEGYLTTDLPLATVLYRLGIRSDPLKVLLSRVNTRVPGLDVAQAVDRVAPQWLLDNLPNDDGELSVGTHANLDWGSTEAIACGLGPVYLLVDPETERYETLRTKLIQELEELTDPQGRAVTTAVHRAEEVYSGQYVEEGPDLVIDQPEGTYISQGYGQADVFSEGYHRWDAVNTPTGLFAARGPAFTTGTCSDLSLLDLAPTLLHLHGCAIPASMDGQVRTSLFARDSEPNQQEIQYRQPNQQADIWDVWRWVNVANRRANLRCVFGNRFPTLFGSDKTFSEQQVAALSRLLLEQAESTSPRDTSLPP